MFQSTNLRQNKRETVGASSVQESLLFSLFFFFFFNSILGLFNLQTTMKCNVIIAALIEFHGKSVGHSSTNQVAEVS